MKKWWYKYWWHAMFWLLVIIAQFLSDVSLYLVPSYEVSSMFSIRYAYWILIVVLSGMFSVYGYERWLGSFKWRSHLTKTVLGTLVWIFVYPILVGVLRSYVDSFLFSTNSNDGLQYATGIVISLQAGFWRFFFSGFTRSVTFLGLGFALHFITDYMAGIKREQALRQLALTAELSALKNQINPHFLYNTLSYLYAQARPLSDKLSEAILLVSDMMRYSLHDEGNEQGLVVLDKEVQHIENFIKIHQLRFDNTLTVHLDVSGSISEVKILPLVLLSFVENAFKHGQTTDPKRPIEIVLKVNETEDKRQQAIEKETANLKHQTSNTKYPKTLCFEVKNHKSDSPKEFSHGIGLANVRRRLELVYPNKHTLTMQETDQVFEVTLTIEL
jgi:two-component system, LytTR family, sensor kinase